MPMERPAVSCWVFRVVSAITTGERTRKFDNGVFFRSLWRRGARRRLWIGHNDSRAQGFKRVEVRAARERGPLTTTLHAARSASRSRSPRELRADPPRFQRVVREGTRVHRSAAARDCPRFIQLHRARHSAPPCVEEPRAFTRRKIRWKQPGRGTLARVMRPRRCVPVARMDCCFYAVSANYRRIRSSEIVR
jgi:hypothetical protein